MLGVTDFNSFGAQSSVDKWFASGQDIVNSLSPENIKSIVYALGADRCEQREGYLIFPTLCHNLNVEQASMKLYYYFDKHIFVCYTECDEAFNIFGLVIKVKHLHGEGEYNYHNARDFILGFLDGVIITNTQAYQSVESRYRRTITARELPEYNSNILKTFIAIPHVSWLRDGITPEAIKQFDIRYSIHKELIVIPYRDIAGRLVGIRVRNLNYTKDGIMPKYCPLITSTTTYSHPLSLTLYGVYENQQAIRRNKTAIVFQGEKSVLLHKGYYGNDSCAVAVCGSNLSKPQVDILVKQLGVRRIVLALDKEYVQRQSRKAEEYFAKLYRMCQQYINYATFEFVFDSQNYINEKDSPVDKGKAVWERLYDDRVLVKG